MTRLTKQLFIVIAFILISAQVFGNPKKAGQTFVEFDPPPMVWLTTKERAALAQQRNDPRIEKAYLPIQELAQKSLKKQPQPLKVIVYEGHVSNNPERIRSVRHLLDMLSLRALSWAYVMSKNPEYASQAKDYLLAWTRTYIPTGNDVNENKLDACFLAYDILKTGFSEQERQEVAGWLGQIATMQMGKWKDKSAVGNRAAKRIKLVLLASLVLDRNDWRKWAEGKIPILLSKSLRGDGGSGDLEVRDAMHYHISCVKCWLQVAHVARASGIRLYDRTTPAGASIRKSVRYVLPYVRGEKVHREWIRSKVSLDRKRGESGDPYYRPGKPWDPQEAYELLILASTFDPVLLKEAKILESKANEDRWLKVLAATIREKVKVKRKKT